MTEKPKAAKINVDIPPGAGVSSIGDRLEKAKLIRSSFAFTMMARIMGETQDMKAGEYQISPNLSVAEIINTLVAGDAVAQWVVIPEGLTLTQIAQRLQARRLVNADVFIQTVNRKPKNLGLAIPIARRSANGYLMPDTYRFPSKVSERQVAKQMLNNWNVKVLRPNSQAFRNADLPMDKIIIIASLIEREAKVDADRAKISSVIRNRLAKKMKLEIDATVLFALGGHKDRVTFKDLKVKNPYNTYYVHGLPPGPICNPGKAAIDAALKPAKTSYLFYVAQPDGSHIFANTYAEHQANIKRVKAMAGS